MDALEDLFLYELELLGFEQLFWHPLGIALSTQTQRPQLFAELRGILVQEACKLYLQHFDVWLMRR